MALKDIRPLKVLNTSTQQEEIFYPATSTDAVAHPTKVKSLTAVLSEMEERMVFDISAANASGTPPVLAKYADLTAALGTNGENIPDALRKGGMSVKFVQNYDNKYVQYRLMSDTFNTTVANWQGVDGEPIAGSQNLIESGGVASQIDNIIGTIDKNLFWSSGGINIAGQVVSSTRSKYTQPFLLKAGESVRIGTQNTNIAIICTTNLEEVLIGQTITPIQITSTKDRFETYTYTAENDINLVLCVDASNYILNIFNKNSIGVKLPELEIKVNGGEITKDLFWEDGWISSSDYIIRPSSASKYTQPFLLKAGESVSVGTSNANIGIICTTTSQSLSLGDTVIVLQKTTSDNFETHTFVAEKDTYIVLCVRWSDYSLHFYYNGISERLSDINKTTIRTFAKDKFDVAVAEGQTFLYRHNIKMFAGELMRVICSFTSGMYSPSDFYFYLRYEDGTNSSAFLIPQDRANYIQLPKNIIGVTLLSNIPTLAEGIVTCDIALSYNSIYGDWSFIVPDYYNSSDYLSSKSEHIEKLMMERAGNADIFAFITDEHWERNAKNSPSLLKYLYEHINIEKCISGGDSGHLTANIELGKIRKRAFGGKILPVIGNHEYLAYYYHSGEYNASRLENKAAYAYFMGVDGFVGNILRGYYYYDDPERKLRYVILSAYQPGEEHQNPNETYYISAVLGYEQEQLQWLEDVALNVENGWNIIIATHNINGYAHEDDHLVPVIGSYGNVCEILLRYNGGGKIICVLAGHTHRDGIVLLNDDFVGITENKTGNTIPIIVTNCDAYDFDDSPGEELENRQIGTINETAFDIDLVDYLSKSIHCIRIGAPADLTFHKSGVLQERILNYEQKSVSVNDTITLTHNLSGSVSWNSADTSIATVDSAGVVTGVAAGSVFINAVDSTYNISATFIVKVIS